MPVFAHATIKTEAASEHFVAGFLSAYVETTFSMVDLFRTTINSQTCVLAQEGDQRTASNICSSSSVTASSVNFLTLRLFNIASSSSINHLRIIY